MFNYVLETDSWKITIFEKGKLLNRFFDLTYSNFYFKILHFYFVVNKQTIFTGCIRNFPWRVKLFTVTYPEGMLNGTKYSRMDKVKFVEDSL